MARVSVLPRLARLLLLTPLLLLLAPSAEARKPGVCPALPPGTIGACIELCSDDESCPGQQKCCSNGCGHTCVQPQQLHPVDPLPDKPGECRSVNPRLSPCPLGVFLSDCEEDWDCPGSQKCCVGGCRMRCMEPVKDKTGFCPFVDTRLVNCSDHPQVDTCRQDWHCPSEDKCCSTGCVKVCQKPVHDKAGLCPYVDTSLVKCAYRPDLDKCQQDWQCPCDEKCCSAGCAKICRKPEKPGSCMGLVTDIQCNRSEDGCDSDSDCPGHKKCCSVPCGVNCVDPWDIVEEEELVTEEPPVKEEPATEEPETVSEEPVTEEPPVKAEEEPLTEEEVEPVEEEEEVEPVEEAEEPDQDVSD